jgi:hypothetical protein
MCVLRGKGHSCLSHQLTNLGATRSRYVRVDDFHLNGPASGIGQHFPPAIQDIDFAAVNVDLDVSWKVSSREPHKVIQPIA